MWIVRSVSAFGVMLTLICSSRCLAGQEAKLVNGAYVVDVRLNGTRLAFLLDSSAERCAIDKDTATRMSLSSIRSELLLKLFGTQDVDVQKGSQLCVAKNKCSAAHVVASCVKEMKVFQ